MLPQLILYGSALLGTIGVALWFWQEWGRDYQPPSEMAHPGIYHLLERTREKLFHGSRDVRFTIFAQDPANPKFLRPVARLGWGRPSSASGLRFEKGEGMAGKAWQEPNAILVARFTEGERSDTEIARKVRQDVLDLRPETAAALSEEQLHSQMLIAISLTDASGWFRGVLSMDFREVTTHRETPWLRLLRISVPTNPIDQIDKDNIRFWLELSSLATQLAAQLCPTDGPIVHRENLASVDGASQNRISLTPKAAA
jgi:hypothetical protein